MLKDSKCRTQIILEKDVKIKLQEMAQKDSRSLSNFVNKILKDYIEQNNKAD